MKRLYIALFLSCVMFHVFGNTGNELLRERIYVQTDKKVYLSGEPIRLKMLTLDAEHLPLILSKIAYAELVDDSIGRVQTIVTLSKGVGEGMMQLPIDLPSGVYRLIAYTRFMRNEGAEVFFETAIGVINPFQQDYYPQLVNTGAGITPINAMKNQSGSIALQTDKSVYAIREQGELSITGLPENLHTLSVAIAGKDLIDLRSDEETVTVNGQLFDFAGGSTENGAVTGKYIPEFEGHILTGKLVDNQTGQSVSDRSVKTGLTFAGKGIHFFPGQITETGEIRFLTAGMAATENISTVVYDADDKYRVDIVSPFVSRFSPKTMPVLSIDSLCYNQLLARSVAMQASRYFLEAPPDKRVIDGSIFKIKPANSYLLDEYTRFPTMREVFTEFVSNARFERQNGKWVLSVAVTTDLKSFFGTKTLVLLDGIHVYNHEIILNIDPALIERINIYTKRCNFGGELFDGMIELISYPEHIHETDFGKAVQIIPYAGLQAFEPLAVPDYADEKNRNSWLPDTRHTLLWEHDVQTKGQSAIHIPFDTSDLKGEYQVTVEGLTTGGVLIHTTAVFSVEGF